jgi:predicted SAM-dependent methyltransferase
MFDAALMVNVLEHIKDDKEVLELLHSVLNPNGYLLIFVPALQALYSDFDRAVGHHRRYHLKNLKEITETAGFEILKLGYFDWLGASAWWLVNVILQSKKINPKSAKLYDRIGVPVTRTIERIISPPFGKNLIMVAKKIKL